MWKRSKSKKGEISTEICQGTWPEPHRGSLKNALITPRATSIRNMGRLLSTSGLVIPGFKQIMWLKSVLVKNIKMDCKCTTVSIFFCCCFSWLVLLLFFSP